VDNHLDVGMSDAHHLIPGKVRRMAAYIEYVCREHTDPHGAGPLITPVDGRWGYCRGNASEGHKWTRIEPTSRERLDDTSVIQERRAS